MASVVPEPHMDQPSRTVERVRRINDGLAGDARREGVAAGHGPVPAGTLAA